MYRNRRGLCPVTSNHICTYNAAYRWVQTPACTSRAVHSVWCVFWHRVSEIAPHAQRHPAPHKAAATNVADMRRQAGSWFSVFLPLESCELDPPLVSNSPQDHNHMAEMKQSLCGVLSWQIGVFFYWVRAGGSSNKHQINLVSLFNHAVTLSVFCLLPNLWVIMFF